MSRTYEICCHDCRETLWVGQGWPETRTYIYDSAEHIAALGKFLFAHQQHRIEFGDDEYLENDDYREVDEE